MFWSKKIGVYLICLGSALLITIQGMAALFSAILELPPLKQAMASKQFKSVYLDRLLAAKREKG